MPSSRFVIALLAAGVACESNAPGPGIDACDQIATFKVDSTTTGRITSADCNVTVPPSGVYFTDLYSFTVTGQADVSILMQSDSFDTYVELWQDNGAFVAVNDDSANGSTPNAFLEAIVPAGTYLVAASTFVAGVRGPYTLTTATRPGGLSACSPVWVLRGVTIQDSITATDCDVPGGGFRVDRVMIAAAAGTVIRVNQRSTALDAKLELWNFSRDTRLAENDDSSVTTNDAWIAYTLPSPAPLLMWEAGTSTAGETGAYTLAFSAATTLTAPPARRVKGLPPRVAPR